MTDAEMAEAFSARREMAAIQGAIDTGLGGDAAPEPLALGAAIQFIRNAPYSGFDVSMAVITYGSNPRRSILPKDVPQLWARFGERWVSEP
ncbi:hypothetical protein [Mesorhizobium sp.]|uniref:hypothetical protein n=1 Tax=Mesorhizobium sp. TaxID=1871066 RepID=UPI000FEA44E9|nr:hypothetical protein [Mesorhizobium sp.]RWK44946.1 MAG: hypothetical protein EOR47_33220 [Mesorhizobium sp.]RWO28655.1 MAG: hypothetical protein EOS08_13585 [Mesorhizobium sp.]TIP39346.1 MAG: hypothetical protein E5X62_31540 [Mesorhizobium sp.]TIQ06336.1 MAG: hypothetical protein E5X57_26135 [Mesorhizobium sp.]TJV23830.1 MAG: hypothetical protein E5Y16_29250 [Mesorhizobium sp.]